MNYEYKAYDDEQKQWYFGELEILVDVDTMTKKYFIVNNRGRTEFDKKNICKLTPLRAGKNLEPVYDKDIISINFNDGDSNSFIVKRGEGKIYLDTEEVILNGLMLHSFGDKDYLFSTNLINNSENILIVGNILENHLNEF